MSRAIYVILAFRWRNEVRLDVVLDEKRVVACAGGAILVLELAVQQFKRLTRHMDLPAKKPSNKASSYGDKRRRKRSITP